MEDNEKRIATPIFRSVNPMGYVVAMLFLEQADYLTRGFDMEPVAEYVTDDLQYGEHVRLSTKHTAGEREGMINTRAVIIHQSPKGVRDHVVRFAAYGRDEHVVTYRLADHASVKIAAINYLTTGDIHPDVSDVADDTP